MTPSISQRLRRIVRLTNMTAFALVTAYGVAGAGSVMLSEPGATADMQIRVTSYKERKFHNTLKQQADFSCGSAAMATLLTYHYNLKVAEKDVLNDMILNGDRKQIEERGFSLLDMKEYLLRHGLQSGGFRVPLEKIAEVRVPGIVLINHNGYNHFVVLEGIRDGRVLLADPALGTRSVDASVFQKEWNGVLFLVLNNADSAQGSFNLAENWSVQPHASWSGLHDLIDLTRLGWRNAQIF